MGDIADGAEPPRLKLLGGFTLLRGREEIAFPASAQRLVALLALRDRPLSRGHLAGLLWPDCPPERSLADLRTALWRANHVRGPLIAIVGVQLRLRADVHVDTRALFAFGRAAADHNAASAITELAGVSWPELALDLLPDWDDEWLVDDRERLRQLRLHALESMTEWFSGLGRHVAAIEAALAAVTAEPLRETAHAALIRAHLAEGNRSEALRQFHRCRNLLAAGLSIEPSAEVRQLIANCAVLSAEASDRALRGQVVTGTNRISRESPSGCARRLRQNPCHMKTHVLGVTRLAGIVVGAARDFDN